MNLLTTSNARIPIRSHGEGTQSLSVLLLFSAYLHTRLQSNVDQNADPIISIEEPEAHLHPNAVRSVWKILKDMPGQKIVTTHSGDILSEVDLSNLRKMSCKDGITQCTSIEDGLFTEDDLRKLNHHVRHYRGELLFARCWLLVEGETDSTVFAECAQILQMDLHQAGVRIVEYSQVDQTTLIKLADALDIKWFLVSDGDIEGKRSAKSAKKYLNARDEDQHIRILKADNMEVLLCESGYGAPYQDIVGKQQRSNIKLKPDQPGYWNKLCKTMGKKSKPSLVRKALLLIRQKQESGASAVPTEIEEILKIVARKSP